MLIVVRGADRAGVNEELGHRVDADVDHAGDRPHGGTLAEHAEDLDTLGQGQFVHAHRYMNFYA
jgi:hypothetical protein